MIEPPAKGSFVFAKMSGAGNDFIVAQAGQVPSLDPSELARCLCQRRMEIGADGLLFVSVNGPSSLLVQYWNADGSPASFCGNGARCAARFAHSSGLAPSQMSMHFGETCYRAEVTDGGVEIEVEPPRLLTSELDVALGSRTVQAIHVLAQVEHLIFAVEDLTCFPLQPLLEAAMACHPELAGRVNVSIAQCTDPATVHLRTFERGSGETLACGSAALAAAYALFAGRGAGKVQVIPASGIPLEVGIPDDPHAPYTLAGEARIVYQGSVVL